MAHHRRVTSTGQDSAVNLYRKNKGHEDANVHTLDKEDNWYTSWTGRNVGLSAEGGHLRE